MTENDLKQYIFIEKEIDILGKELLKLNSHQLIRRQGLTEKLYLGAVIEETAEELSTEISSIKTIISDRLHRLYQKRVDIETYIDLVDDCEIRLILRLRYINGMSYDDISSELTVVNSNGDVMRTASATYFNNKIVRFFKQH
jgi:DNA-directed RNA polymerase specialized sigma24 family protein